MTEKLNERSKQKRSLIIGYGEIGKALHEVLSPYYEILVRDIHEPATSYGVGFDVMHICFPYNDDFLQCVKKYQQQYTPQLTIIHSTVPVGTSAKCGAVHSPIRGMHPNLAQGIRTFVKFVSGSGADEAAEYFRRAGLRIYICRDSRTTELAKIADTSFYAVCVEFVKELERICNEYGVPFAETFTIYQQTYNEGWSLLGRIEYCRPVLTPIQKRQGGHCTLPNLEFYKKSQFANLVKELNRF